LPVDVANDVVDIVASCGHIDPPTIADAAARFGPHARRVRRDLKPVVLTHATLVSRHLFPQLGGQTFSE